MLNLAGRFVPIATPFTDDGSGVSEIRLARLVRRAQEAGAGGFVVCSDAAEFTTLSFGERKTIVEHVLRMTQGAAPVIVNVSSLNTSSSLDLAQHAERHGARAVVMLPPFYDVLEPREVEAHFRTVVHYAQTPVYAIDPYHVLVDEVREHLAAHGRFMMAQSYRGILRTDCFEADEIQVSPSFHFSFQPIQELEELVQQQHPAKFIKAIFGEMDVELGPVRQPLLPLHTELVKDAVEALAQSS